MLNAEWPDIPHPAHAHGWVGQGRGLRNSRFLRLNHLRFRFDGRVDTLRLVQQVCEFHDFLRRWSLAFLRLRGANSGEHDQETYTQYKSEFHPSSPFDLVQHCSEKRTEIT